VFDKLLGNGVDFKLFSSSAIDGGPSSFTYGVDSKFVVEQGLKVAGRTVIEGGHSDAVMDDPKKVRLKTFHNFVVFIYDLRFADLVYEDAADFHFKGWGLEGLGEVVGRSGDVVELRAQAVVDVKGDATIETVVDHIPLELG